MLLQVSSATPARGWRQTLLLPHQWKVLACVSATGNACVLMVLSMSAREQKTALLGELLVCSYVSPAGCDYHLGGQQARLRLLELSTSAGGRGAGGSGQVATRCRRASAPSRRSSPQVVADYLHCRTRCACSRFCSHVMRAGSREWHL